MMILRLRHFINAGLRHYYRYSASPQQHADDSQCISIEVSVRGRAAMTSGQPAAGRAELERREEMMRGLLRRALYRCKSTRAAAIRSR